MLQNVNRLKFFFFHLGAVLFLSCTISLLPVGKVHAEELSSSSGSSEMMIIPVPEEEQQEPPALEDDSKKQPTDSTDTAATDKPLDQPAYSPPEAEEDKQDKDNTLLIVGAGAAAAAALALALSGGGGGGGGGEGGGEVVEPESGVNIAGSTWTGYLDLVGDDQQSVTAVINQDGSQVQITTSSTQRYGKVFTGTIDSNGDMLVYDQTTGEAWTTHKGPASSTQIDLYDYVNNYTGLDQLFLRR